MRNDNGSPVNPPEGPPDVEDIPIEFVHSDEDGEPGKIGPEEDENALVLKDQLKELEDRHLRHRADFENFKRRVDREREGFRKRAVADVVSMLLPIMDNLERAIQALHEHAQQEWVQGIEIVQKQLVEAIETMGVQEIEAEGRPFDPVLQEAVAVVERPDVPPGTVTSVLEKGYRLEEKVLKPAKVEVNKTKPPNGETPGESHV